MELLSDLFEAGRWLLGRCAKIFEFRSGNGEDLFSMYEDDGKQNPTMLLSSFEDRLVFGSTEDLSCLAGISVVVHVALYQLFLLLNAFEQSDV